MIVLPEETKLIADGISEVIFAFSLIVKDKIIINKKLP